jgi:hypothetical protein
MFWLSTIFMKFAIFFLELFINLAKYNNYVNAPTVIIGWLLVRDIANMFFVVVLLVIAIGTILGIEQYEWKKTLVKFVFAAIFINFSKLICGLIIDVAHVFTITFLNAIQALAGGNLISMFKMSEIQSMLESTDPIAQSGNFVYALFASAILALMMSGISMVAIGAYAIVMLARVVVLWVLIILSPLAFIMGVIPQAQSYSKQIWDKFGKQVMVAPVMVFFLWLSFATLGSGDAASQFGMDNASLAEAAGGLNTAGAVDVAKESDSLAVSISKAGTWENLASFMVAIAFMLVGINVVQGMGVVAGGLVQKAQDFGMSVAKIASGYTLGRKLAGTAWKGAKGLGKTVAWNFPGIGGERWALLGKTIGHNILASYRRAGTGLTKESIETGNKIAQVQAEKSQLENAGLLLANKEAQRQELIQKQEDGTITEKERKILNGGTDEETGEEIVPIAKQIEDLKAKKDMSQPEREALIKSKTQEIQGLQALQNSQTGGPIGAVFGWFARSQAAQRKHLRKSQGQAETLEKILSKRVGAEAGGWVFNRKSAQVEAQDRVERGILEAEDMRSKSKDDEFIKMGKAATLATTRQKWTGFGVGGRGIKGFFGGRETGASMVGEIVSRQRKAAGYESVIKALTAAQHISIDVGLRNKLNEAQKLAATGDMHKLNVLLGKEMPTEEEMEAARLRVIAKDDAEVAAGLPRKRRDEEGWEEAMRKEAGYDPQAVALVNEEMAKTTEAQQKEAHSNALKALAGTDVGKEIYTALAEAEIGAKMGEDFIKGIKNDKLRDKFKKAAEVYNSILDKAKAEGWDEKKMHHEIQNLANSTDPNNKFAAAIFYEENAHRAESQLKTAKSGVEQALDQAENKNWDEYLADKNGRKLIEDMLAQGKDREEIKAELEKMKKEGVAYSGDALGLMDDVLKGKAYEKVLGMYGEGKTDEEVEKALAESDFGYSLEDIKGFDKNKMLDLNDPKNRNLEGRQFIERLLREGKNREEIEATLKINGQSDKYLDEILKAKAKEKYDAMLATGKSTSEIDQEMQKYGFTNEQFFGLDYAALKQPIERPHHDSFRMQMAEAEVAQKGIERYFVITKRNSVRTAEAADKMEQFNEEEENAHTLERAVKNAKQEVGDAETDLGFIKSGETAEGLGKKLNGDGTTVGLIADRDTRKQALDNIGENLDVYGFAMQEANSHMAEVGALVGGKEGRDALATKLAELK